MSTLGRLATGIPQRAVAPEPAAPKATPLGIMRPQIARGESVTLPVLGPAYVRLVGHVASNEIESGVLSEMKRLDLPATSLFAFTYELERDARTLAEAVRDPGDPTEPFGTLEEWRALDDDVIFACYKVYADVKERLDPVGADALTEGQLAEIGEAFKKKDWSFLRSLGVVLLVNWLRTMDDRPASSPTPKSSTGPSSPASSAE